MSSILCIRYHKTVGFNIGQMLTVFAVGVGCSVFVFVTNWRLSRGIYQRLSHWGPEVRQHSMFDI